MEKQLRSLSISDELVKIKFDEIIIQAQSDEEGENDQVFANKFTVESANRPRKELLDSMKKLRKFALELCEIEVDSKSLPSWTVSTVKISGDYTMKKSRIVMELTKTVKRTGKDISLVGPQVTMYPDAEANVPYENADKMTQIVEDIIAEVWLYLDGYYGEESDGQLPLFPSNEESKMKVAK